MAFVLELAERCQSGTYVVGGAVRDYFLATKPQDLDVIIPNHDTQLTATLEAYADSYRTNRHGNRRYFFAERTVDVIRPNCFYQRFGTAEEAVQYFDLSINALAVRLADASLFDPWHGIADIAARRVRTTGQRWAEATDFEGAHLLLRLLRYVQRYDLRLVDPQTILTNMPKLERVDWSEVQRYHAISRDRARQMLLELASAAQAGCTAIDTPRLAAFAV